MRHNSLLSFLVFALAAATLAATGCTVDGREFADSERREFHFTEPLEPGGLVELKAYKGNIRITAWDRPEVDVRAVVRPGGYSWGIRIGSRGGETEVEVDHWGNTVSIRSRRREHYGVVVGASEGTPFVDYDVRVPRRVRLELKDYKSSIHLADLEGQLRINTYNGDLEVENFRGSFDLETYKGSVRLDVRDLTDSSSVETYKGLVRLRASPDDSFRYEAKLGRRADFLSDFPVEVRSRSRRRRSRQRIEGTVGDGSGPLLRFSSYKGTLELTR